MPIIMNRPFNFSQVYRDVILADTPVGYWKLDEAPGALFAVDEIGSQNGDYENGATSVTQITSSSKDPGGSGMTVPGASDYVSTNVNIFNNASWSVELWMRTSVDSRILRLFDNRGTGAIGSGPKGIQISCNLTTDWGNTVIQNAAGDFVGGAGSPWSGIPWTQDDNNPHHIVLTFDNTTGTATLFFDGGAGVSETEANLIGSNLNSFLPRWGMAVSGSTQSFTGDMDEIALYNYALTQGQVTAHYNAGV